MRTLMLTMLLYALGTAACALATNMWMLMAFRVVASLGIGGEWAAGAAMVAEVVPEKRRVEAGALLYTSAPLGLFLARFANFDHRRRSLERESVDVVAVRVPVRPDPRGGRLRRAHLRQRTGALEAGRGIDGASTHRASCSRPSTGARR